MAKNYSVFDIVGPNMIGPSSSHTAGAARLGKAALKIAGKPVKYVKFLLHGSFAETYKGHGTDKALVGGILGYEPDDARIRNSFDIASEKGVKFEFEKVNLGNDEHPNTVKMLMELEDGSKAEVKGASTGGGNIKITELNGLPLDFNGANSTLIMEAEHTSGCAAFITGILAKHNKNILSLSSHAGSISTRMFVKLETAENIEKAIIDELLSNKELIQQAIVLDKF